MSKSKLNKSAKTNYGIETENYIKFHEKIPLTSKEQTVFYGLVKFPELNDQKLSRKLKIKRSTVTAIRNKLRRQNFYKPIAIPHFKLLGCELMTIIWGRSSNPAPLKEKMKIPAIRRAMQAPETVFQIATDNEFFALLIFKNFTEFKKMEGEHMQVYKKYSGEERNVNIVHFPFETSEIISLFDYSSILEKLLKIEFRDERRQQKSKISKPQIKLKEKEKTVLGALIKYPELNDKEIAEKINTTRQTFSKIKSRLIKQGAIRPVNEPNFNKIGCELFVNMHIRFNALINPDKRMLLLKKSKEKCPVMFDVESSTEELCFGIFEDYLSFKIAQDALEKVYKQNNLLLKEHVTMVIPLQQIKFQKSDFISITEKALNTKIK